MSKILIVDDHPLFREGVVSALIHLMPGSAVIAAPSVLRALELLDAHADLDLVLIDLQLPEIDGFEALKRFGERHPSVARVVISGQRIDEPTLARIMRLGASGFIPKTLPVRAMVDALLRVLDGDLFLPALGGGDEPCEASEPPASAEAVDDADAAEGPAAAAQLESVARALSVRQLEVLCLVGQGRSNKDIARRLDIAERTVKAHASRIFEILGASNRTQAVLAAQKIGLLAG